MAVPDSTVQEEAPASITTRRAERAARKIVASATTSASAPDRITEAELAELRDLNARLATYRQQEQEVREAIIKATGVIEYLAAGIKERYAMLPGDALNEDGTIQRAPRPASEG